MSDIAAVERILERLPADYEGPGGAAAVLHKGRVVARHSWGWADTEARIAFTPQTMFRICSITKQFTCGLVLDQCGDPAALDAAVRQALPLLATSPTARDMCHNQSGLRDYWALTALCGAPAERVFDDGDARRLMGGARSLHFTPGTAYSYTNQNFRLLGDLVAERAGRGFDELLRARIFDPAGMAHAMLAADTAVIEGGTVGYEGSPETGFRPAVNRIHWTGDAGIGACLDDMVAWEMFIDATRDDAEGLYRRLSAPVTFGDGAPASYGFGLARGQMHGRSITSHGGGLRGWRSFRLHAAAERVSVVVLFNHMADARDAAAALLGACLGEPPPTSEGLPIGPEWSGAFLEPSTGLVARLEPAGTRVRLHFGTTPELVDPTATDGDGTKLRRVAEGIEMHRPGDGLRGVLVPLAGPPRRDVEGAFRSAELGSEFAVAASGGELYGVFSGVLGDGEMQRLIPVGPDVWRLPCPRALDYHPPGDWTVVFARDGERVTGARVGCWLARGVEFTR